MESKNKKYMYWGFGLLAVVVMYLIYKAIAGSPTTTAAGAGAKSTTTVNGIGGLLTSLGKALGLSGTTTTPATTTPAKPGTLGCSSWTVNHAPYTQVAGPMTNGYDSAGYNSCGCDITGMNIDGSYC